MILEIFSLALGVGLIVYVASRFMKDKEDLP